MADIKQLAMQMFKAEREAARVAAEQEERNRREAALAQRRAEEEARIRMQEERELARLRAEKALAEMRAKEEQAALAAAVQAELERLRNRSEVELLRDELAELRQEVAALKAARSSSKHYNLSVVANNQNLGIDPHHGCGKILRVTYKCGDSEPLAKEVEEHQTLVISGQDLKVIDARWFTNPNRQRNERREADVTAAVLRFLNQA